MTDPSKQKSFDCVAMMREIRAQLYAGTEDLSEEEFERWLRAQPIEDERLRDLLEELEREAEAPEDGGD